MRLAVYIRRLFFDSLVLCLLLQVFFFAPSATASDDNCSLRVFGRSDKNEFGKIIAESPVGERALYYGSSVDVDSVVKAEAALSLLSPGKEVVWTRYYGTESNDYITAFDFDPDGNIFLAYETYASDQYVSATVLKLSPDGGILWQTVLAKDSTNVSIKSLAGLENGDVAGAGAMTDNSTDVVAERESDFYLIRLDSSGAVLWEQTYGGPDVDYVQGMSATSDGGFVLVGDTRSFQFDRNIDVYVVKTNGSGDVLWSKVVGDHRTNGSQNIIETADGDYVFVGESVPGDVPIFDVIMGRFSNDGELRWLRHNGGEGADAGFAVAELPDGRFVVTGYSNSFNTAAASDVLVMLTDSAGREPDMRYFGGSTVDIGYSIELTTTGEILIAGTYREMDGVTVNTQNFLAQCSVAATTGVGDIEHNDTLDYKIYYTGAGLLLRSPGNFPVGTHIVITDLQGREVYREAVQSISPECVLHVSLPRGVYTAVIRNQLSFTRKIFLVSN